MAALEEWSLEDTVALCQHVCQHGADEWTQAARTVGRHAGLCALRWHVVETAFERRAAAAAAALVGGAGTMPAPAPYADFELGVLLLGTLESKASKRRTHELLAGWLAGGRSAEAVKQAYKAHVRHQEAAVLALLQASGLPSSGLRELLCAWRGPSARHRLSHAPAQGAEVAQAVLAAIAAGETSLQWGPPPPAAAAPRRRRARPSEAAAASASSAEAALPPPPTKLPRLDNDEAVDEQALLLAELSSVNTTTTTTTTTNNADAAAADEACFLTDAEIMALLGEYTSSE